MPTIVDDGEAFGSGGVGEPSIGRHETSAPRPVAAPDQRCRKLKGIGRTEGMCAEQAFGTTAHVVGGEDLVPPAAQVVEPCECLRDAFGRQRMFAMKAVGG